MGGDDGGVDDASACDDRAKAAKEATVKNEEEKEEQSEVRGGEGINAVAYRCYSHRFHDSGRLKQNIYMLIRPRQPENGVSHCPYCMREQRKKKTKKDTLYGSDVNQCPF